MSVIPEFFEKDPIERWLISLDWTGQLPSGYTPVSVALVAYDLSDGSDVSATVLQSTTGIVEGFKTLAEVKAGSNGSKYKIKFIVSTSPTGTFAESVEMHVRER